MGAPFWDGWMGWLCMTGEFVSCVHLAVQSEGIGWIEDCFWMSVQVAAICTGDCGVYMYLVSIPFLTYMTLMH